MAKKYFIVVIFCFALMVIKDAIEPIIRNSEVLSISEYGVYLLKSFFNVSIGVILVISFIYLYKKYEK
ncbi:MAG: hypothetical protein E7212_00175 [Clostridium sartagoforme]|nr:hypothetical protein [Clostridium sartagoforme]